MRKRTKKNFARKMRKVRSASRRRQILASYWGWTKWGDCRNLWNKLTDHDMSFSDYGIKGRNVTRDGQRFFDVRQVTASDILNMDIEVLDFVTDVKTKNGPGRYAVMVAAAGDTVKFITGSITLKSQLDQAAEQGVLPIATRLRKRDIGSGRYDYYFE